MGLDDISKARVEEAIFTSPGMLSLRSKPSITLKQEAEMLQLLHLLSQMLKTE